MTITYPPQGPNGVVLVVEYDDHASCICPSCTQIVGVQEPCVDVSGTLALLPLAEKGIRRLSERRDEDIDAWATRLAKDSVELDKAGQDEP